MPAVNSPRILLSGVSGPIGAALMPSLMALGYQITRLVRGPASGETQISWDPLKPLAPESVSGFEAVIHLAGESIVGRWTEDKKKRIRESRVEAGTRKNKGRTLPGRAIATRSLARAWEKRR